MAIFGLGLPSLVKHDRDLGDTPGWWYEQVGWVLLGLIGLHVVPRSSTISYFAMKR